MFGRKKPRKNYRRGKKAKRRFAFLHRFFVGFKIVGGLALLTATSALFIFVHDVVTQCDYFKARHLIIEGNQRLSKARIADQAQVSVGMNILAVNLTAIRKHLLAHPWIAEAEVIREIPSGLRIRLKEHAPLAIVDLGRKFLINESGEIFKEWTPADPSHFPVVSGLQMSDIATYAKRKSREPFYNSSPLKTDKLSEDAQNHYSPLDAVMHVLRLGKESESILPNHLIKQILVDPEIGLTLHAWTQVKTIKLGYDHYADKYNMLKHIIVYLKKKQNFPVFDRIDLNNLNRIVVSPKRRNAPAGDDKEV